MPAPAAGVKAPAAGRCLSLRAAPQYCIKLYRLEPLTALGPRSIFARLCPFRGIAKGRFGMERTARPQLIAVLDSWRGLFALAVVLLHAPVPFWGSQGSFVQSFYLAVDFFLVLSGFVIAMNYERRLSSVQEVFSFAWRRFWRLYPLHITTLVLMGLMVLVMQRAGVSGNGHQAEATLGDFLNMVLLLHAFGTTNIDVFNWPSWSISAEIWSYLVFALVVFIIGRRDRLRLAIYAAIGALGLAMVFAFPADPGRNAFLSVTGLGIGRGLFGFFTGVLTWRLFDATRFWQSAAVMTFAELVLIVLILAGLALIDDTTPFVLLVVALFPALIIVFAHQAGAVSKLLDARPFMALGTLSYGIYLWHLLVAKCVAWALYRPLHAFFENHEFPGWTEVLATHALLAAYIAATIVIAALSYRWVEKPVREWSRRTSPAALLRSRNLGAQDLS